MKLEFLLLLSLIPLYAKTQSNFKIAFGSCLHAEKEAPILDLVSDYNPNVFIFLGDNIYGDTYNVDSLLIKYKQLASNRSYQNLISKSKILATWDDHDYGKNDDGKYNPIKLKSKEIMLDFFGEAKNSKRRKREGIYTSYYFKSSEKTIQVILLDLRTFRSNLVNHTNKNNQYNPPNNYVIEYDTCNSKDSTFLGKKQWKWLKKELNKYADARIICSSTQFAASYNGYETWSNFPLEQKKIMKILDKTKAKNVLFISGDAHYAELSKIETNNGSIFDCTSSGITESVSFAPLNSNRVGEPVMENNFGLIECIFKNEKPYLKLQIIDLNNSVRIQQNIKLE